MVLQEMVFHNNCRPFGFGSTKGRHGDMHAGRPRSGDDQIDQPIKIVQQTQPKWSKHSLNIHDCHPTLTVFSSAKYSDYNFPLDRTVIGQH